MPNCFKFHNKASANREFKTLKYPNTYLDAKNDQTGYLA